MMRVLESFAFALLAIVAGFSQVEILDPNYRETASWYSYYHGRLQEGIIPKAIRLLDKVNILKATPLSLFAEVPSESSSDVYEVSVVLNPEEPLIDFSCTCPWGEFRARPCKHVLATVLYPLKDILNLDESNIVKGESYIIYLDFETYEILKQIHKALNKSAYFRVKKGEIFS